jgi:hypothetical protein
VKALRGGEVLAMRETPMEMKATEIMNNIIRLAELLDDEALKHAADIPILEMAKSVSIKQSPPRHAQNHTLASRSLPPRLKRTNRRRLTYRR